MKKCLLLTAVFVLMNGNVLAQELPSCGENCTYTMEDGVLTIMPIDETKEAKVQAYNRDCTGGCHTDAPWYGKGLTRIEIKPGITDIGVHAFEDMHTVTSLELPEGLRTIGEEAFNAIHLSKLELPSTLTHLGAYAFSTAPIEEINAIPEGIAFIGRHTFTDSYVKNWVIPANITRLDPYAFGGDDSYTKASVENIYCEEKMIEQCNAAVQWKKDLGHKVNVIGYQKDGNGVFYKGAWYQNANDILTGKHIKKLRYTVEEAMKATEHGDKFHVYLTYK